MLTQLWLSGEMAKVAGIVYGKFTRCNPSSTRVHGRTLEDVLRERSQALSIPTLRGLTIGHVEDQTTVPIGCMAELDVEDGVLRLLEEPVK